MNFFLLNFHREFFVKFSWLVGENRLVFDKNLQKSVNFLEKFTKNSRNLPKNFTKIQIFLKANTKVKQRSVIICLFKSTPKQG